MKKRLICGILAFSMALGTFGMTGCFESCSSGDNQADVSDNTAGNTGNTTGSTTENTSGSTTENTSGSTTENTSGSTTENTTGSTTENTTGGTTENTSGSTTENTTGGTTENTSGSTTETIAGDSVLTYSYGGNECAAFEWADSTPADATVEYKLATETTYTKVDSALVRAASTSGYARADVVGLKGGATYNFRITTSAGETTTATKTIAAYDRSGYAHFNATSGVGAYNDDGTLKSGAVVVYVTEETKNTVTATVDGKTCTGIVDILQNAGKTTPLDVRIIGTVGAATWNEITYSSSPSASDIKGVNGTQLPTSSSSLTQAALISGGYNTLNTSVYSELNGLTSKATYKNGAYDSYWNMCDISGVSNVTVEGIGEDARIFQWGFTWSNCSSIEVRNLTFEDYTEDACSFQGGSSNISTTDIFGFTYGRYWVHNNTFEEGKNYWDVCDEQDKHEGDGGVDVKRVSCVTISYNVFHNNHKTGLVGADDATYTAAITFHHNYYNACVSRLPLARMANMHMYNNYYYGSTGTNMSLRAGAYALIENCYFENAKTPIECKVSTKEATSGLYGYAKVVDCTFSGCSVSDTTHVITATRTATIDNDNVYSETFDTDSSLFYYDSANGCSDVSVMFTAEETKTKVPLLAGVQKHNGSVVDGDSSSGSSDTATDTTTDSTAGSTTDSTTDTTASGSTDNSATEDTSSGSRTEGGAGESGSSSGGDATTTDTTYTIALTSSSNYQVDSTILTNGPVTITNPTKLNKTGTYGKTESKAFEAVNTEKSILKFVLAEGYTYSITVSVQSTSGNFTATLNGTTQTITTTKGDISWSSVGSGTYEMSVVNDTAGAVLYVYSVTVVATANS